MSFDILIMIFFDNDNIIWHNDKSDAIWYTDNDTNIWHNDNDII